MGNTTKDEAYRLADELVRVTKGYDDQLDLHIGTHWDYGTSNVSSIELARKEIVENIANAIREAIESRDRILTDMLSESEAFHEGWRQGAVAMRNAIAKYEPRIGEWELPEPPSYDDSGEPLAPSSVHLRAQRMECFIKRLIRGSRAFGSEEPMASIAREARETLEESTNATA